MTGLYYADEAVELWCGDFRELLPEVVARHGTPDLALVDPPYNETSLAWDRWPDGWPSLMPGRSMWCFGSMRMFLDHRDDFAGWKLSQDVVWEKHNGSGFATDRFRRVHETVTHWYRGDWGTIWHDTPRVAATAERHTARDRPSERSVGAARQHTGRIDTNVYVDDGRRLARSVQKHASVRRGIHPTEKPVDLLSGLIEYGCAPGGLVLDVFAGGCSTLVAARNLGRRAVGIELREEQCAKAVEWRLSQTVLSFDGDAS